MSVEEAATEASPAELAAYAGLEYDNSEFDVDEEDRVQTRQIFKSIPNLPDLTEEPLGFDQPLPEGRFADRELSWLAFNERVLEQAEDTKLPLLERAWFCTIFTSNLDEFYMVRVAGLKRRIAAGIAKVAASGLTPRQVLDGIEERTHTLCARQARYVRDVLVPELAENGMHIRRIEEIPEEQRQALEHFFLKEIFPVLTPLAVDPSHPFPYISGLSVNLAVVLRHPSTAKQHFARIKVPDYLPRLICVERALYGTMPEDAVAAGGATFISLEDLIADHLDRLFPGMEIIEHHAFRVTRNEDVEVEEDDAENLLTAMEQELRRRKFGPAVRLEVSEGITPEALTFLSRKLEVTSADVFKLPEPLDLRALNVLHDLDLPKLKYPKFVPRTAAGLAEVESATPTDIFAAIRQHDILVHHPYDAFSTSVQHFITSAANDPQVEAIKQTLYRTSSDSPIVGALIDAARAGKQVVAIVEIKARFDEDANISWARKLERAGVHVVYGMLGLKTHCKLSLVVRRESDGLVRYCHVGTGNYHPKTARGYEDLGLLTCDVEVAQDMTRLFNLLSGFAPQTSFNRFLVAPRTMRSGLIEQIEKETQAALRGEKAWIGIKVNSIVDEAVIDSLYRASQAGVRIDMVVRGICALRAGVPGLSENIRVRSILGRYLEHSRIYAFANGGDPQVWIGSADLMHRNLDRRVEAVVRITDPQMRDELIGMLKLEASPKTSSWRLRPDGTWRRRTESKKGVPYRDIQEVLMEAADTRFNPNK